MQREEKIRKDVLETEHSLKLRIADDLIRVFKAYNLPITTLLLSIELVNRIIVAGEPMPRTLF